MGGGGSKPSLGHSSVLGFLIGKKRSNF